MNKLLEVSDFYMKKKLRKLFRESPKIGMLIVIFCMTVGFAAITTLLTINGKALIGINSDDFKIYFQSVTGYNRQDSPCEVISGDGTSVGDEVRCGTEEFYIIGHYTGNNVSDSYVKMLAKYNVYRGTIRHNLNASLQDETISETDEKFGWQHSTAIGETPTKVAPYVAVVSPGNDAYENSTRQTYAHEYGDKLAESLNIEVIDSELLTKTQLGNLGCVFDTESSGSCLDAPEWVYSTSYWTAVEPSTGGSIGIESNGAIDNDIGMDRFGIRPVITIHPSYFVDTEEEMYSATYGKTNFCEAVTGDGTNPGDEVKCGTESFYIVDFDGDNVRLLSKYNLYVGNIYYEDGSNTVISTTDSKYGLQHSTAIATTPDGTYPYIGTINMGTVTYEGSKRQQYAIEYGTKLESLWGIDIVESTLLTTNDLENLGCVFTSDNYMGSCTSAPSWVYSTSYWTELGCTDACSNAGVGVDSDGRTYPDISDAVFGSRPIITISKKYLPSKIKLSDDGQSFTIDSSACYVSLGTGKNVGDEITCGTESFYIMSVDDTNIKMLSKYNINSSTNRQSSSASTVEFSSKSTSYTGSEIEDYINDYSDYLSNSLGIKNTATIPVMADLTPLGCVLQGGSADCTSSSYSWVYSSPYWVHYTSGNGVFGVMTTGYVNFAYYYETSLYGIRPIVTISTDILLNSIDYKIVNDSTMYDVEVNVMCNSTDNIVSTPMSSNSITSLSSTSGSVNFKSDDKTNTVTCTLDIQGLGKTSIASNVCKVTSGTGNSIGDEVKCGSESFYIYAFEDDNVRMISKYNLNIGYETYLDDDYIFQDSIIEFPTGLQDIRTLGGGNYSATEENPNYSVTEFSTISPFYHHSIVKKHVDQYEDKLENMGVQVIEATILTHNEAVALGCGSSQVDDCNNAPAWLFSTSYWLKDALDGSTHIWSIESYGSNNYITVDYTYEERSVIGVRPVIVMKKSKIG